MSLVFYIQKERAGIKGNLLLFLLFLLSVCSEGYSHVVDSVDIKGEGKP